MTGSDVEWVLRAALGGFFYAVICFLFVCLFFFPNLIICLFGLYAVMMFIGE